MSNEFSTALKIVGPIMEILVGQIAAGMRNGLDEKAATVKALEEMRDTIVSRPIHAELLELLHQARDGKLPT